MFQARQMLEAGNADMAEEFVMRLLVIALSLAALASTSGCDRKPSTPPKPTAAAPGAELKAGTSVTGGGSGHGVAGEGSPNASTGPANGGTAIGGVAGNATTGGGGAGSAASQPPPTAGDAAASGASR